MCEIDILYDALAKLKHIEERFDMLLAAAKKVLRERDALEKENANLKRQIYQLSRNRRVDN